MQGYLQRRRELILLAALLAASGVLALAIARQHVALRDAWRVHDLALTHWQMTGEQRP